MKLQSFTTNGQVTLVPNPSWSGTPKPSIAKLVELPFTSEAAIYNQIRSGGPSAITIANLPAQYAPQSTTLTVTQGSVTGTSTSFTVSRSPRSPK